MNELTFVALVAWAIPPVVSFLKNRRWPSEVTIVLVATVSLAVATVGLVASGDIDAGGIHDVEGLFGAAALAFTEASVIYRVVTGRVTGERINEALTSMLWDGQPTEGQPSEAEGKGLEFGRFSK